MIESEKPFYNQVYEINSRAETLASQMELNTAPLVFDWVYEICLCLDQPETSETDFNLELKRLIHKSKISVLCEGDAELVQVENVKREMEMIGHTDFKTEISNKLFFARYYSRNNLVDRAESILADLKIRIEENHQINPDFFKRAFEHVREIAGKTKTRKTDEPRIPSIMGFLESIVQCSHLIKDEKLFDVFDKARKIIFLVDISEDWRLEVKRQIAEIKLKFSVERNFEFKIINKLHDEISELGFRSIERRSP